MLQPQLTRTLLLAVLFLGFSGIVQAQYCTSNLYSYGCGDGDMINSFSTTGGSTNITNNSSGCGTSSGYTYYSNQTLSVAPGDVINFSITSGDWDNDFVIFVDFNGDGDFTDPGEEVYHEYLYYWTTDYGSFTVPLTATPGLTRLRVRCNYDGPPTNSCSNYYFGEVEDYNVMICSPPEIDTQPIDVQFCAGSSTLIMMGATGAVSYQWQVNPGTGSFSNVVDNANYSGSNTDVLAVNNIPSSFHGNQYRCIVTSSCGGKDTTNAVFLNRYPPTEVSQQPLFDTTCSGVDKKISVQANGAIGYQWQMGDLTGGYYSLTDDAVFSGVNTTSLNITKTPDSLAGKLFRLIAYGPCATDTSEPIALTLLLTPSFIQHPQNVTVPIRSTVKFRSDVDPHGGTVQYYWQASYDSVHFHNIIDNSLYENTKTSELIVRNVSLAQGGLFFRMVLKSSGSCGAYSDTSEVAKLSVYDNTGIAERADQGAFQVYPNPVLQSDIWVRNAQYTGAMHWQVVDRLGRTVLDGRGQWKAGENQLISVESLIPGLYSLRLVPESPHEPYSILFERQ